MKTSRCIHLGHQTRATIVTFLVASLGTLGSAQTLVTSLINSANGHTYELWRFDQNISWTDAKTFATGLGSGFNLVAVTSQQENDWLLNNFLQTPLAWNPVGSYHGPWIGGYQPNPGVDEPAGGWNWVTGESWSYTNWRPGEPNNAGGTENFAHFIGTGIPIISGYWNDLPLNGAPGGEGVVTLIAESALSRQAWRKSPGAVREGVAFAFIFRVGIISATSLVRLGVT